MKMDYNPNSPKGFKKWLSLQMERNGWLLQRLFTGDFKGFREAFWSLDRYLATKHIDPDTLLPDEERKLVAQTGAGVAVTTAVWLVAVAVGCLLTAIYIAGPQAPLQPTRLPAVPLTPTAIPIMNTWGTYDTLSQAQARELRDQQNVLNVALLEGGGATYLREYGAIFNPNSPFPWRQNDQPIGLTNLTVNGTWVKVGADGQVYSLNVYQGFARLKDPMTLYLVDKDGHIWMAKLSDNVLKPLSQIHAPIQIAPNPELSFTF
jgi:hypothetical protein